MKLMRLAVCAAVFAVIGGIAMSEDLDVQALQARLAAQEARLNDLQAKVGGSSTSAYAYAADMSCGPDAPEALLSRNKNALVKIGGTINTRYFYKSYDMDTSLVALQSDADGVLGFVPNPIYPYGDRGSIYKVRTGDLKVSDANLKFEINVNDNFDAYVDVNLLDSNVPEAVAQRAWVRWKNICNSGFGVLVGKNDLVFGEGVSTGVITPWTGGGSAEIPGFWGADAVDGAADVFANGAIGPFIGYDHSRTVQINPYWESQDGKWRVEASLFQGIDFWNGGGSQYRYMPEYYYATGSTGYIRQDSLNYGWGSASARIRANVMEGLMLSASVINTHYKDYDDAVLMGGPNGYAWLGGIGGTGVWGEELNNNSTAVDFAFKWNPCFLNKFTLWGQYLYNWNAGFIKDRDVQVANLGASYFFTDAFGAFFQGDYMYGKNKGTDVFYKQYGWALYGGFQYKLPYGAMAEIGWRHDNVDFKDINGNKHTIIKGDTIYGHLGFDF